jgi:hypothetical protein
LVAGWYFAQKSLEVIPLARIAAPQASLAACVSPVVAIAL